MSARFRLCAACVLVAVLAACRTTPTPAMLTPTMLADLPWSEVERLARGTTVTFAMWSGDNSRNAFFRGSVASAVETDLDVTLQFVPVADVADVVNKLLNETTAAASGSIDVMWVNGENFRTARQGGALWGPFADALPNITAYPDEARATDFGTPTDGYEAPWEFAQFVFAYDTTRVPEPPTSLPALRQWIMDHPGRFTYPAIPDFTGSAFIRHVLFHQSREDVRAFSGPFDERVYTASAPAALEWLRDVRPSLWRAGETYPATPADLDRLFSNSEVDFSMNYSPGFASERIARGEFPPTTRTFVLEEGTIANYSFLAIPFNAPNPAGALAVINALLSAAHAIEKLEVLGGVLPMAPERLPREARRRYEGLPAVPATLPLRELAAHRVPEADVQYLLRFERDWRSQVLQR